MTRFTGHGWFVSHEVVSRLDTKWREKDIPASAVTYVSSSGPRDETVSGQLNANCQCAA